MLDYRHETFLALCRIRNYTRTAEALHLTQPAVTQHIKALVKEGLRITFLYEAAARQDILSGSL